MAVTLSDRQKAKEASGAKDLSIGSAGSHLGYFSESP